MIYSRDTPFWSKTLEISFWCSYCTIPLKRRPHLTLAGRLGVADRQTADGKKSAISRARGPVLKPVNLSVATSRNLCDNYGPLLLVSAELSRVGRFFSAEVTQGSKEGERGCKYTHSAVVKWERCRSGCRFEPLESKTRQCEVVIKGLTDRDGRNLVQVKAVINVLI